MAIADLTNGKVQFGRNLDTLVIVDNFQSKRGGVTLDVTGFSKPYIRGGHVVIKETSTGDLKPMPLNSGGTAYDTLPSGHTYYGHVVNSVLTSKPFVGITRRGVVNHKVVDASIGYYDMATILSDLKTDLTLIDYLADNE